MTRELIINGYEIKPGEKRRILINIAKLPSHSSINISINVSRGKEDGPTLLLMGGLHGDEINGVEIVRRMIETDLHAPLRGSVICIPILNIYGFIHFSRYLPDGKDVNRSFPGNKNGSLASRLAHYVTHNIIPQIDYGVDFHTGGGERTNFPQVRCVFADPENEKLAEAFHAPFTLNSPYRAHSLRQTAGKLGKKILVYEGGESVRFDEFAIVQGIEGARRLMKHLDMIDDAPHPLVKNTIIRNSSWVRAKVSGMFTSSVESGQQVKRNQLLGYITDTFGDYKKPVKSPAAGYVIGLNNNPLVHQGDAIMHLGVTKSGPMNIHGDDTVGT
ncbi:MAG: succinylglutamate desuccinylase/aspartoacylase family protein [Cyclobacteriaceae bacterium]|nr:succinylglutamate desuccinylase/aspartoacylase family protein [Cyclobacteriaceae bacterium]